MQASAFDFFEAFFDQLPLFLVKIIRLSCVLNHRSGNALAGDMHLFCASKELTASGNFYDGSLLSACGVKIPDMRLTALRTRRRKD